MKYYKKGGFFYRLENLSKCIDRNLLRLKYAIRGDTFYMHWFTRIARFEYLSFIENEIENNNEPIGNLKPGSIDFDLISLKRKHYREYVDLYNREKYWWMKKRKG